MHIQQNHMKQKIKVDLDIVEQTLQDIQNHLKGLHQKNFIACHLKTYHTVW